PEVQQRVAVLEERVGLDDRNSRGSGTRRRSVARGEVAAERLANHGVGRRPRRSRRCADCYPWEILEDHAWLESPRERVGSRKLDLGLRLERHGVATVLRRDERRARQLLARRGGLGAK